MTKPLQSLIRTVLCCSSFLFADHLATAATLPAGFTESQIAGGLTAAFVAGLVHRLPHGPPSLSVFLPSFWLLVPGSLEIGRAHV